MSLWRVGGKVPQNVYKGDLVVCQCQTPELAAEIVAGMNDTKIGKKGKVDSATERDPRSNPLPGDVLLWNTWVVACTGVDDCYVRYFLRDAFTGERGPFVSPVEFWRCWIENAKTLSLAKETA